MISHSDYERARHRAGEMIRQAGILARPDELAAIEVADLGLGMLDAIGLQIMTLVNTAAIGAKVLVLLPGQVFAEHRHPPLGDYAGKEETFRCQWGDLYLYVPGAPTAVPAAVPPPARAQYFGAAHEIRLRPGEQYTVAPNTWHWFAAGPEGAVAWSFSPQATDAQDQFSDPQVVRRTVVAPD